jgi:tetratricopeptide (TPR) repeat protein
VLPPHCWSPLPFNPPPAMTSACAQLPLPRNDERIAACSRVLALDLENVDAYINARRRPRAQLCLRASDLRLQPGDPTQSGMSTAIADDLGWYKISNREQAIVACSRLLALNPKFAPAYFNRGVAYYARAITTARSPTTAGRSGSIRKTLSPIVGGRSPTKSP